MINWKTDRRVQLAIGLAIVVVGAKWLFTGSLLFAVADLTAKPAEGQTSAGVTISALVPVVLDLVIGGLIFIGSYAINLAELVFGRVKQLVDTGQPVRTSDPPTSAADTSAPLDTVSLDSPVSMRRAISALGDAAAANDLAELEKLRKQIRKPYAMAALNEAYTKGDSEAAAALVDELNKMLDRPAPAAKKKGNGAADA